MQYNPEFVAHRPILSDEDRRVLHTLAQAYPLDKFRRATRNYEEMTVDFVYTSAKIEGNTYDRIDTDNLLRMGITAGGKRYSDAMMLVNLRAGFDRAMLIAADTPLSFDYLCDMHKILMKDLLPTHQQGFGRQDAVRIGATVYEPLSDPARLRTEVKFIMSEAERYGDVFEKAIYLHCNLAYLQYFEDGNKRTARMMQTAAMVKGGVLPLFFNDTLIGHYTRATITYYETGNYAPYVSFFKDNYRLAASHLLGHEASLTPDQDREERQRRITDLPKLAKDNGVTYTFWRHATEAIKNAGGDAESVDWLEIERRTIIESIGQHGHSPEGVYAVLFKHSPGMVTKGAQESLRIIVEQIATQLQVEYARSVRQAAVKNDNPESKP